MVNLTIGGGSFKGLAFIGALDYLYTKKLIDVIDNFYGCSVGSMIGIFLIIGYKPDEMFDIIANINMDKYSNFSIQNLDINFSLLNTDFFDLVNEIFSKKEDVNITIKEFVIKYSTNINIFAVNISNRAVTNFNMETFPDLPVLTAIRASSSIPFIFPPVIINDNFYVDGCFKCLNGDFHRSKKDKSNINLGYILRLTYQNKKIDTLSSFASALMKTIMLNNNLVHTKNTIEIDLRNEFRERTTFNNVSYSDKVEIYYQGLKQACKKLENIEN